MKKFIILLGAAMLILPSACASAGKKAAPEEKTAKKLTYSEKLEKRIHILINAERKKYGLKPLKYSKKLQKIAEAHSKDMAKRNYVSHVTPEGLDPTARAKKAEYNVEKLEGNRIRVGVGENIFEAYAAMEENGKVTPYLEPLEDASKKIVKKWMQSPPHKKNIIDKNYTLTGIGVAVSKDKKVKITQLFF